MGSKKILEEMYKLVAARSEEPIEESKFNNSILNSLKVKTVKERNAVLNELLIMLELGNEAIGKVSNGNFTCFPDIIQRTEELVIQRFETEEIYAEKKDNDTVDIVEQENREDNGNNNISDLIDRYDDLSDLEFRELLDNIGKMDDSQMTKFLDSHEQNQAPLVESGIKSQEEVDEDKINVRLMNALQDNDLDIKSIAGLMVSIKSEVIDSKLRDSYIMKLAAMLNQPELSEKAKKFCEELGIFKTIEMMSQTVGDKSNADLLNEYSSPVFDDLVIKSQTQIWKQNLYTDKMLAQLKRVSKTGNHDMWLEVLRENGLSEYDFEQTKGNGDYAYTEIRKQNRFKVVAREKETFEKMRQNLANAGRSKTERPDDGEQRTVKGPQKRPLRAVRNLSELGKHVNRGIFQNNFSRNNIPIKDFEMGNYFERFALPVNIPDFKSNITRSGASDGTTKKSVIGEIIVESIKKMTTRMDGIRKLLASKASKGGIEEASTMLFDLAAEIDDARINDGDGSLNNPTKSGVKTGDDSKIGEIPDGH